MKPLNFVLTLAALAFAGCSPAASGGDDDTGTSTADAGPDADADGDSDTADAGCDTCPQDVDCCKCGEFEGTDAVCDTEAETQYGCEDATGCGAWLSVRHRAMFCPGDMFACTGALGGFGAWQDSKQCAPYEVCDNDAGACVADLVACPAGFNVPVCVPGGTMKDCGIASCIPQPTMDETLTFGAMGAGEVVRLDMEVAGRSGLTALPFSDIVMTLEHDGVTASFYNQYETENLGGVYNPKYEFPTSFYLPHFWGKEMGGAWTLHAEDSLYNGKAFVLTSWCLTFLPAGAKEIETTGSWDADAVGDITNDAVVTVFEMMIPDIATNESADPVLHLAITHASPNQLDIALTAADGTIIQIKDVGEALVADTPLTGLSSEWLTGMYELRITDTVTATATGTLDAWSITL